MGERFDAWEHAEYWWRELNKAIARRGRTRPGNNPERRMFRKWVRHCRACAKQWETIGDKALD